MTIEELKKFTVLFRMDALEMIHRAQSGYPGGMLSALDIMAALYFGELRGKRFFHYDRHNPQWDGQDYFVLSKTHAAPALYVMLAEAGFFPKEELQYFCQPGALLQAVPHLKIAGVTVPSGHLGSGLSVASGIALALKLDRKSNRVYALLGDEELQNGQIWEAALTASHYVLDNLCIFVDLNEFQADGSLREIMNIEPIQDKFEAFGWKVIRLLEGNNVEEILWTLDKAVSVKRRPTVILAHTIQGKGIPFLERKVYYHSRPLSESEMVVVRQELEKQWS